MKKIVRQITLATITGTALTVFSGTGLFMPTSNYAVAQEQAAKPERQTRRTPTMRANTFKYLERAQLALEEKDYEATREALEDLSNVRNINSYEEANMWNFYAFYYFEIDDTANAIKSFENILQLEGVPIAFEDNIRFQLAQLEFSEENYSKALEYLDEWFLYAVEPQASAYIFRGQLYYAMENFDAALSPILKAIELTEASGAEVKENWYLLLLTIYYEKTNYEAARDILEYLVVHHNKPRYWLQLASMYSELKNEPSQLATMEVAYNQGYLTEESHLRNMAQLYMYNEVPIKAAEVMRKGFAEEVLEETQENYELQANALISSQELEDSIPPLVIAAGLAEDGELSLRLGQVYMARDEWAKSITALIQAIEKGDLRREDQGYMVLGMAYFNNDQLQKAKDAFQQSRKDSRSRTQSAQWIRYINNEANRREQLALSAQE